jgi:hypothetical protein
MISNAPRLTGRRQLRLKDAVKHLGPAAGIREQNVTCLAFAVIQCKL